MTTTDKPDIIKRPKVGDTVDLRYGLCKVLEVGANGQTLVVRDALGRRWPRVTREPGGHWVRTARAPEPTKGVAA